MSGAKSLELTFQLDIIEQMVGDGWRTGPASGYDRTTALYTEDLLAFVREAYPDRWQKFSKNNPQDPSGTLVKAVVRELDRHGTLEVLRHGFKVPGVKIDLCSFRPDHGMNPERQRHHPITTGTQCR